MALGLLLSFLPGGTRETLAQGIRASVLSPVLALQRGATDREGRLADVAELRAERDSLAAYLVAQADVSSENQQLRALLGLRPRLPFSFVPAEVIRVQNPASRGAFLLTAGAADQVRAGSPIVTAAGLVGLVRNVNARSSVGIEWTDPDFRASATTLDGVTYGIVEPRGGEGEQMLLLTGTPLHTQLDTGTLIVTSGRGGVYPQGVPIGKVAGTEEERGGWRRNYLIRPLVSPAQMGHVLILGEPLREHSAPDLASAWGIRLNAAPESIAAVPPTGATILAPQPAPEADVAPLPARPQPARPARPTPRRPRLLGVPVQPPPDTGGGRR